MALTKSGAANLQSATPPFFDRSSAQPALEVLIYAYYLPGKPATIVAVAATVVIAAVTSEAFIITTKESFAVGLFVLIPVAVPPVVAVAAVVAMPVSVKVRPLRIVVLSPLGIVGAGVHALLVALVQRDLIDVAITSVATVLVVTTIVAVSIVVPIPLSAIVAFSIVVPIPILTIVAVSIAPGVTISLTTIIRILIAAPWPLCLRRCARC